MNSLRCICAGAWVTALSSFGASAGTYEVAQGDPKANDDNDTFTWKVDITFVNAKNPKVEVGFNSAEDFRGPRPPVAPPLSPREKFAQVLLMSNEFLYID